jgi:hypothetical protein
MININDVPKELLDLIKEKFDSDQRVIMMRVSQRRSLEAGDYQGALLTGQKIEALFQEAVSVYIKEAEHEADEYSVADLGMTDEEEEKFLELCIVMFMSCDIINSAVMDAESILHRYDKNFKLENFLSVTNIAKEAQAKLEYLQHNSNYLQNVVWGEKCDNMFEMMKNKAKSIINKEKRQKGNGRNTER